MTGFFFPILIIFISISSSSIRETDIRVKDYLNFGISVIFITLS